MRFQEDRLNFGTDLKGLPPACALNDKQALALKELFDDLTLTRIKTCNDVKTFFEQFFWWIALPGDCMSYSHRNRSSFPTSWTARAAIRYTPGRRVVAYQGVCLYGSSILRRPSEPPSSVEAVPQLDTPPVCPSGRHVSRLGQEIDQALARSAAGG